jgi:hypothetical protein
MKIHVHWMKLMKNQIIQKIESLEILKERVEGKRPILKPFGKKIMFNGFKMSNFMCTIHVQEVILPKHMFGCPLKLILGFFGILKDFMCFRL